MGWVADPAAGALSWGPAKETSSPGTAASLALWRDNGLERPKRNALSGEIFRRSTRCSPAFLPQCGGVAGDLVDLLLQVCGGGALALLIR